MQPSESQSKFNLNPYFDNLKRFWITVIGLINIFILININSYFGDNKTFSIKNNDLINIWLHSSIFVTIIGVGIPLALENHKNIGKRTIFTFALTLGVLIVSFQAMLTKSTPMPHESTLKVISIYIVLGLSCLTMPFIGKNEWESPWNLLCSLFANIFIVATLTSVAFTVLSYVLFGLGILFNTGGGDSYPLLEYFLLIYSGVYTLFIPLLFLMLFPKDLNKPFSNNNLYTFIRSIFAYIMLPAIVITIATFLIIITKSIITWSFPDNTIARFTFLINLSAIVCLFILRPAFEERKSQIINIFYKHYPPFSAVLTILFLISLGIRINNYGFTISRIIMGVIGLMMSGFVYILVYKFEVFIKYLQFCLILFLLISLTPIINFYNIAENSQTSRLEELLKKDGVLQNGQLVPQDAQNYPYDHKFQYYDIVKYLLDKHGSEALYNYISPAQLEALPNSYNKSYTIVDNYFFVGETQNPDTYPYTINRTPVPTVFLSPTPTEIPKPEIKLQLSRKGYNKGGNQLIDTLRYESFYRLYVEQPRTNIEYGPKFEIDGIKYTISLEGESLLINGSKVKEFSTSIIEKAIPKSKLVKDKESQFLSMKRNINIPFKNGKLEGTFVVNEVSLLWNYETNQIVGVDYMIINMLFDSK